MERSRRNLRVVLFQIFRQSVFRQCWDGMIAASWSLPYLHPQSFAISRRACTAHCCPFSFSPPTSHTHTHTHSHSLTHSSLAHSRARTHAHVPPHTPVVCAAHTSLQLGYEWQWLELAKAAYLDGVLDVMLNFRTIF